MGLDLGDRTSSYCMVSEEGKVLSRGTVVTSIAAFQRKFGRLRPLRVVLETGTHSGWASWTLKEAGHEVIVANARQLSLISRSWKKSDQRDPEMLARLGRRDLSLLAPVEHARPERQLDLARIRARDAGVRARTLLINNARNLVKSNGYRLPACGSEAFGARMEGALPQAMVEVLKPLVSSVAVLTREIREYDRQIEQLAGERYPETALLRQVKGVGALTATAFVLRIGRKERFRKSRDVAAYLGLVPRRDQSGGHDPQLSISKAGDGYVRRLLVGSAHYILGPFGEDCDLRRKGLALAARGGKNAKKRAVVAIARRLAVLLHRLWVTGEEYEPLRLAGPVPVC
jgi:transposase